MPYQPFVPLRIFSAYTMLEGAIEPKAISKQARKLGFPAAALTDLGRVSLRVTTRYPADGRVELEVLEAPATPVAVRLRVRLVADGLDPVVKTSGSKGMQVYAPIRVRDREHPSRYAKALAQELSAETPDQVVWRMEKVLRPGKVLIDWSQNNPAKTTVAPYSLRARPAATVSTPIGWDEVDAVREGSLDPAALRFTAEDVLARVEEYGDLFDVAGARRAPLPEG